MLSTQRDDEDDSQYLLVAKIDNARSVSTMLKAIHFKDVSFLIILIKKNVFDAKMSRLAKTNVMRQNQ